MKTSSSSWDDATCFVKHVSLTYRPQLGTQNPNPVAQKCVKWDDVAPLQAGRPETTLLKARQVAGQNAKTKTQNLITVAPSKAVWQLLTGGGEKQLTIQRKFVQIATVRE